MTTADLQQYSVDLQELCRSERERTTSESSDTDCEGGSCQSNAFMQATTTECLSSSTPTYGESWFISYVLHTTNNEHSPLHQPFNTTSAVTSISTVGQNQQTARESATAAARTHIAQSLPPQSSINHLIRELFSIFHPFCPILDRPNFLVSVDDGSVSVPLIRCVLFVASIHCDMKFIYGMGYGTRIEAEDDLFRKAKADFEDDIETDTLTMLYCSYLLHYWSGRPSKFKDSMWWLSGTIRCAQSMGMHRSMRSSKVPQARQRSWRKIWWLLYVRSNK